MKMKIQIKSVFGKVLFEYEKDNNSIKDTLIEAIRSNANLRDANLCGANLGGANLGGANLRGAYLGDANLGGANLGGAYLGGAYLVGAYLGDANLGGAYLGCANLCDANLGGAYLVGAYLGGANLGGANLGEWGKLQSASDMLIIGCIGSRNGYTTIFHTDKGMFVLCECFRGTLDEFEKKVKETHQGNKHERDYLALIQFVKIKFEV
jgi:hypothetical protein